VLPTTDLLVALFADQGVTLVGGGGGDANEVTAWADQDATSGPHDLTQGTPSTRAEYDATGGPEGGPAIAFGQASADGNGFLEFAAAVSASASKRTYFVVLDQLSISGSQRLTDAPASREICALDNSKNVAMYDGSSFYNFGPTVLGQQLLCFQADTSASRAFRNGTQIGTDKGWGGDLALPAGMRVGADSISANPIDAVVSCFLIYNDALNSTVRAAVRAYLGTLYPSLGL
jgi:hypothetical protein